MRFLSLAKRWLYISHRWLGILLCLFMAIWFVSGVVMMYVGYPKLTPAERLAHLPDLVLPEACCVSPQQAFLATGLEVKKVTPEFRLVMLGKTPYWLISEAKKGGFAVNAVSGVLVPSFDATHALEVAGFFGRNAQPHLLETISGDIFTVSRALDPHRPLHRLSLDDVEGTELYVSSRTGEVVRDSNRLERVWNWAGSIMHWLYPLKGEWLDRWRADIIIYLSLFGTILSILGLWIGLLRWRFHGAYRNGSRSPYRAAWMKWHHLSGLIFGVVTMTWIFSGLMSMNPWKIFESAGARPDNQVLAGVRLDQANVRLSPSEAISRVAFPVRELTFRLFDGHPYYVLHAADGHSMLLAADEPLAEPFGRFSDAKMSEVAHRLMPGIRVESVERLENYDTYYYARRPHTMSGHIERRLPVLRVKYADPQHTWLHLDPYSGSVHSRIDDHGRVKRWLFNFLHSWDAWGWTNARPAWDIVLILLSAGGFILCMTGVVVGWQRLFRPTPRSAPRSDELAARVEFESARG